jgi:cardiolipin synthase A/B
MRDQVTSPGTATAQTNPDPTSAAAHSGAGVAVLTHYLKANGPNDVAGVASVVSAHPADRAAMLRMLHTQLGNSYVQGVVAAMSKAAGASATTDVPANPVPDVEGSVKLFSTPDPKGHPDFVASIKGAKKTIFMEMYHLTDMAVVDELIAAKGRSVDVKVLLDKASIDTNKGYAEAYHKLQAAGVSTRESSAGFSIQHAKAMVVDGHTSFVTSVNLTGKADSTRDFGLILEDQKVANEMLSVFNADWQNSLTGKTDTPTLTDPNLVWSPNDSEAKLSSLIDTAKKTVIATVENLDDPEIQNAFVRAVGRGCHVRLIIPEVDEGPNNNWPNLKRLIAGGVDARVMPYPASASKPYMHSKMIIVDNADVYIGSVNFSTNSTRKARELGIILPRPAIIDSVASTFEGDWKVSITPPDKPPVPSPTAKEVPVPPN